MLEKRISEHFPWRTVAKAHDYISYNADKSAHQETELVLDIIIRSRSSALAQAPGDTCHQSDQSYWMFLTPQRELHCSYSTLVLDHCYAVGPGYRAISSS